MNEHRMAQMNRTWNLSEAKPLPGKGNGSFFANSANSATPSVAPSTTNMDDYDPNSTATSSSATPIVPPITTSFSNGMDKIKKVLGINPDSDKENDAKTNFIKNQGADTLLPGPEYRAASDRFNQMSQDQKGRGLPNPAPITSTVPSSSPPQGMPAPQQINIPLPPRRPNPTLSHAAKVPTTNAVKSTLKPAAPVQQQQQPQQQPNLVQQVGNWFQQNALRLASDPNYNNNNNWPKERHNHKENYEPINNKKIIQENKDQNKMSDTPSLISSFLSLQSMKYQNMFEAAKKLSKKCPKCGKLLAECTCSSVKEEVEGSKKDKKEDKAGEKKYGMTHKEWEKSSMDKKEDAKLAKEEVSDLDEKVKSKAQRYAEFIGKSKAKEGLKKIMSSDKKTEVKESVFDLEEAKKEKGSYEIYHPTYSAAVNHALTHHEDTKGIRVSESDRWHHIAVGDRKPSAGETRVHNIPAKDENENHHIVHMQIYNRGGNGPKPYELNTYSSKMPVKKMHEAIEIKPSHKGLFTKKAHAAGESVSRYAEQEKFAGGKLGKEANFALNAKKWHHEEVEQIDEISADTVSSYRNKAMKSADSSYKKTMSPDNMANKDNSSERQNFNKRMSGLSNADNKLSGKAKVNATEEIEQIDELSKKTLKSYVNKTFDAAVKAKNDYFAHGAKVSHATVDPENAHPILPYTLNDKGKKEVALHYKNADEAKKLLDKRSNYKYRKLAYDKIKGNGNAKINATDNKIKSNAKVPATEEVEQIDEISKRKAYNYISHASVDKSFAAHDHAHHQGYVRGQYDAGNKYVQKDMEYLDKLSKKHANRSTGIQRAASKLGGQGVGKHFTSKVPATEGIDYIFSEEELDFISSVMEEPVAKTNPTDNKKVTTMSKDRVGPTVADRDMTD